MFQNRQVNPILQSLMQRMGQMGQGGQPGPAQMGQGPPAAPQMMMPQQQPGLLNQPQQPAAAPSMGGMDPTMMAMLMQKMGQGGMGQQPGVSNPAGFEQLLGQFAGGMPKPDFSKYELPPSFNWMPTGNG